MSVVDGQTITAFNLKLGRKDKLAGQNRAMIVDSVHMILPAKEGGKPRYRLGGRDEETDDKLSLMCNEEKANLVSKELDLEIVTDPKKEKAAPKTEKKTTKKAAPKKTPKKVAKDEDEDEDVDDEDEDEEEEEEDKPIKKAQVKKPATPAKKTPAKTVAAVKKAPVKTASTPVKKAPVKPVTKTATKKTPAKK